MIRSTAPAYLQRLDPGTHKKILACLDQIATEPYGAETKPLTNAAGRRSARVDDCRIVLVVVDADRIVSISAIGLLGRVDRDS